MLLTARGRSAVLAPLALGAALTLLPLLSTPAMAATQQEMESRLDALTTELAELKAEMAQMKARQTATPVAPPAAAAVAAVSTPGANTDPTFVGYGELNYLRPTHDSSSAVADASRFVIGVNYAFDERTRLVSELELEHAVSSSSDPGEIEVEQAYIERELRPQTYAQMGLFLVPSGLLNENHEPTRYYGVTRNHVETAIIPTTWREGGVMLLGTTDNGWRWNFGLSTGFDLSRWDASSSEGAESPLGSIHQELALARAASLSGFVALNYTGVPGLRLGASVFSGDAAQGQPGFGNNRVTLWETHGRWTPGRWDLAALYARGQISNSARINTALVGNPTLIPDSFFGWYGQAAYRLFDWQSASLLPFLRYERYNTAASFAVIAPGLTPVTAPDREVITGGVNFNFARGVVIKADYQSFSHDTDSNLFGLGLGYQF